jgi:hypothetical protein
MEMEMDVWKNKVRNFWLQMERAKEERDATADERRSR